MRTIRLLLLILLGPFFLSVDSAVAGAGRYGLAPYYAGYYAGHPQYPVYGAPTACCGRGFFCYRSYCDGCGSYSYGGFAPRYYAAPQVVYGPCHPVRILDGRGGWVWGQTCD